MHNLTYAVLRLIPNAKRQEIVNIGLAIFEDFSFKLKLIRNFNKIRGICPDFQLDLFPSLEEDVRFLVGDVATYGDVQSILCSLGGFLLGPETELKFLDRTHASQQLETLMREYVYPETNIADAHPLTLFQVLRKEISKVAELSSNRKSLERFGIVEWYPLDRQGWLKSEFAYKTDLKTTFIQTVDLQVDDRRELFRTVSSKKFVGDAIRELFSDRAEILVAYRISERARRVGGDHLLRIIKSYANELWDAGENARLQEITSRIAWTHGPNRSLPLIVH